MEDKSHIYGPLTFSFVLIAVSLGLYFAGPAITGFAVRELDYSDNVNLVVAASSNYTWNVENTGELKSLRLGGKMSKYGKAKVYLEGADRRYLVFDSEKLNETSNIEGNFSSPQENLITGFASLEAGSQLNETNETLQETEIAAGEDISLAAIDNETNASEINISISDSGQDNPDLNLSNETIGLGQSSEINSSGLNGTENASNTKPYWDSELSYFTLNGSIEADLNDYFKDDENDLLFFSVSDDEKLEESINGNILGLSSNETGFNRTIEINASDGFSAVSKEILVVVAENPESISQNISKNISVNLFYKNDSNFDTDNDGKGLISGAIDIGLSAELNWGADDSKLCARWKIINEDEEVETDFCNGNAGCCAFAGLVPRNEKWDEAYYSSFGKDSAGFENSVSAQVIYYDVNLSLENPKSDVYFSGFESLPLEFEDDDIEFEDVCMDSCRLSEKNKSSYSLVFEIEGGAILRIESIGYSILIDVGNEPPELIKNISTLRIGKNSFASIDLSDYFFDPDGDELYYSYYSSDGLKMSFNKSAATIVPDRDFEGAVYVFITANDSKRTRNSNVFLINVSGDFLESEEQIEIGKPVRWSKKIIMDSDSESFNLTVPKSSANISVSLFDGSLKRNIDEGSIAVFDDGIRKRKGEFEAEQELKKLEREINLIEGSLSSKTGIIGKSGNQISSYEVNNNLNRIYTKRSITRSNGKVSGKVSMSNAGFVNVSVNETLKEGDELVYSYETEAPIAVESKIDEFTKEVKIVSETSYQNVKAYTSLSDVAKDAIRLYWIQNGERVPFNDVNYFDENNNELIDKIEWIVPHLSNQTFEISIEILNIQSYPTVGGEWVVLFNTTGIANLTISASNGTTYSEKEFDNLNTGSDLHIAELKCGNETLFSYLGGIISQNVHIVNSSGGLLKINETLGQSKSVASMFVENYSCINLTSYWTVRVITEGKHVQQFNFGGFIEYANNYALNPLIFLDNTNSDFGQGTIFRTNVTGSGAGANVTLNFTTEKTFNTYNASGNFTSRIFDAGVTSTFDRIAWAETLPNSSDVYGIAISSADFEGAAFYKNGSYGVEIGLLDFTADIDFTAALQRYALPAGITYDEIVGIDMDDDASDAVYALLRNGTVLFTDAIGAPTLSNAAGILTFGVYSNYTIPGGFNSSDIVGFVIDTTNTLRDVVVFFKNGTYLRNFGSNEQPPWNFSIYHSYSLPSGFSASEIIGVGYFRTELDLGLFFRNGSKLVDSDANLREDLLFNDGINDTQANATYHSFVSSTSHTNITLHTRVSNNTVTWSPWSNAYNDPEALESIQDRVARYIQYKAVFMAPETYVSPSLENVSINYSLSRDYNFTIVSTQGQSTSYGYQGGVLNQSFYNENIGAIQIVQGLNNGTFLSQVFDAGTVKNWFNISWFPGAYYGSEIGRGYRDGNSPLRDGYNLSINTSGLVLLMDFNNETGENNSLFMDFAVDYNTELSGNTRYNGTCSGATCPNYSKTNFILGSGSVNFSSAGQVINGNTSRINSSNQMTYTAWIYPVGVIAAGPRIIHKGSFTDGNPSMMLEDSTSFNMTVEMKYGWSGSFAQWVTNNHTYALNSWNFIAYTYDKSSASNTPKIYINGTPVTVYTIVAPSGSPTPDDNSIFIGNRNDVIRTFNGSIDEVTVWNRTLSSQEILNIYKRGVLRLNLSVRSCDDSACSGESFSADVTNSTKSSLSLSDNRYFQYRANFLRQNYVFSPEIYNVTIHYGANTPTVDFSNGVFAVQNGSGSYLAVWDSLGNLNIKGSLSQLAEDLTPDSNDFPLYGSFSGELTTVAYIKNPEGDLITRNILLENQASPLSPPQNAFIIQNKTGNIVSYIEGTDANGGSPGNLYLLGTLTENVEFS